MPGASNFDKHMIYFLEMGTTQVFGVYQNFGKSRNESIEVEFQSISQLVYVL